MSIQHRIKPRYPSRQHEIIANLRAEVGAGPPIDPSRTAKKRVAEAAILMALAYGGDWRVQFQPEHGVVVIARRLQSQLENPESLA